MADSEESLNVFKELLHPQLVKEIPEEFFQPGREKELRVLVARCIEESHTTHRLFPTTRKALLESLMADIDRSGREGLIANAKAHANEDAADAFVRHFKPSLRPDLLKGVPDDLFQPGREQELGKRVVEIVDARLIKDKVPIGRQLRVYLITSLMADITASQKERFGLR